MGVFRRRVPEEPDTTPALSVVGSAAPLKTHTSTTKSLPFSTHRNLTAAAQVLDISTAEGRTNYTKRRTSSQGWQDEAWLYSDNIGEISYAFTVVANALSRVRLYAAEVIDPASPPLYADQDKQTGQAAIDTLARLSSAFGGIPGLMRDAAMNLQISGECMLVQRPANPFARPPQPESWDIRSSDEVVINADGKFVIIPREDGGKADGIELPKGAYVARIWRPHPRFSDSATSSMRPILDLCAELMLLNKTFRATARSRLNSGMLYLPDGISVAASVDVDPFAAEEEIETTEDGATPITGLDAADQSDTDEFEEALLEAMTTPIADEESAAAVVPLLVRGPQDLGEKIRYIQFERAFDPALKERSAEVLDRIMQGLDVPKEIVKGLSALKFSTAQIVDVQLYQAHVEPLALLICDALTTVYLRPALRSQGLPEDEISKHVVWYDPSEVTTRPNRAEDADKGFQNHLISGSSWRKAHNFTDDDAPTSTELAVRMLEEKGTITPELAESLLSIIAPEIMSAVREASQAANPETALTPDINDALGTPTPPDEGPPAPDDGGAASPAPAPDNTPPPAAPASVGAPAVPQILPNDAPADSTRAVPPPSSNVPTLPGEQELI